VSATHASSASGLAPDLVPVVTERGTAETPAGPLRVRFCPAPSGWLHVGSVRAALYNWLVARRSGGVFVFRIEDTDAERATEESMRSMTDALAWIGLDWDEGPELLADGSIGDRGPHGPYLQSRRQALYGAVARRLVDAGHLYADHRTAEELERWREEHRAGVGGPPVVKRSHLLDGAIDEEEAARRTAAGTLPSWRLPTPEQGEVTILDLVRGPITFDWSSVSDPVLVRSDGSATYPLANTVDDVAQGIDLVCRGEDLLSVTPRQVLLADLLVRDGLIDEALAEVGMPRRLAGWDVPRAFAHLPMVVGMDRKKLSKRHGSVAVQEFRRQGFLPETLRNYLALLGWSHPSGEERLSDDEVIAAFTLEAVGRSSAAFDVDKLTAFNGERIRAMDADELAGRLLPHLDGTEGELALVAQPVTDRQRAMVRGLVPLVQERMQRLDEIEAYAAPFLADHVAHDPEAVATVLADERGQRVLAAAPAVLAGCDWTEEALEAALRALAEELQMGFGKLAQPVRVAVTGTTVSPPLFGTLVLLGRERVLARLTTAAGLVG
jgi:glutamyl-tRNA synthetase